VRQAVNSVSRGQRGKGRRLTEVGWKKFFSFVLWLTRTLERLERSLERFLERSTAFFDVPSTGVPESVPCPGTNPGTTRGTTFGTPTVNWPIEYVPRLHSPRHSRQFRC
jgi:hypothetical protein